MACYSMNVRTISRGKKSSVVGAVSYISGTRLHDNYYNRHYAYQRDDVANTEIILPAAAPSKFQDLQTLLDELNASERRTNSQLAHHFKLALPNELSHTENVALVKEFCNQNFIPKGRCAVYAIHNGQYDPAKHSPDILPVSKRKDNPHVHIIIPFRALDSFGFAKTKLASRTSNPSAELISWRKSWADIQNRAFERLGLDVRVSHKSLADQGINRQPEIHMGYAAMSQELRGDPSLRGDRYLEILSSNQSSRRIKQSIEQKLFDRKRLRNKQSKKRVSKQKSPVQLQKANKRALKTQKNRILVSDKT